MSQWFERSTVWKWGRPLPFRFLDWSWYVLFCHVRFICYFVAQCIVDRCALKLLLHFTLNTDLNYLGSLVYPTQKVDKLIVTSGEVTFREIFTGRWQCFIKRLSLQKLLHCCLRPAVPAEFTWCIKVYRFDLKHLYSCLWCFYSFTDTQTTNAIRYEQAVSSCFNQTLTSRN